MTDKPDGGPAFPGTTWDGMVSMDPLTNEAKPVLLPAEGMTLRDWYKGQALVGIVQRTDEHMTERDIAAWAGELADAMLAEREEGGG